MRAAALAALLLLFAAPARAADNFFVDLVVGPTGFLGGDADDRFFVSRDFLNASTKRAEWDTDDAELVFHGGASHVFELAGADAGPNLSGLTDNFAWGTLRLASGQSLVLEDGNVVPGGAQYVTRLILEDGLGQISSITGNGFDIYYLPSSPENAYLGGGTYPIGGGGKVRPMLPFQVPLLGGPLRALLSLALLATVLRSGRGAARRSSVGTGERAARYQLLRAM
jgi:hypothetical protein